MDDLKLMEPSTFHLPDDVWKHVFEEVPVQEMQSLAMVNKSLYSMSRPIVYHSLHIIASVSVVEINDALKSGLTMQDIFEHRIRRLLFWTSDAVAPFVRKCTITSRDSSSQDFRKFVLEAVKNRLPSLSNITHLQFEKIPFDGTFIRAICQLPNLQHLVMSRCCSLPGVDLVEPINLSINVTSFEWLEEDGVCDALPERVSDFGFWLKLLHPHPNLRLTIITDSIRLGEIIFSVLQTSGSAKFLTKLTICQDVTLFQQILSILPDAVKIQCLEVDDKAVDECHYSDEDNASSEELVRVFSSLTVQLPALTTYCGPYEFLAALCPCPSLRNLTLVPCQCLDSAWEQGMEISKFNHTEVLYWLGPEVSLEQLRVQMISMPKSYLGYINSQFRNMKSLVITVYHDKDVRWTLDAEEFYSFKDLFDSLWDVQLPPLLNSLTVEAHRPGDGDYMPKAEEEPRPDLLALVSHLREKHPSLVEMVLQYCGDLYLGGLWDNGKWKDNYRPQKDYNYLTLLQQWNDAAINGILF